MPRVFMMFIQPKIFHQPLPHFVPAAKARSQIRGQNWNATDAIRDPTLPNKRLIWAAIGGDYYCVHYERGGIAHTFHVLIAKLAKADAQQKVIWRAVGGPLKDYANFLDALRNVELDDRIKYPP